MAMRLKDALELLESRLPMDDRQVSNSLRKAYDEVLLGYGYELERSADGVYSIHKASTSAFEDTSVTYQVTTHSCTCPNFPKTRGNLCKHRLAVMILEEMQG